MTLPVKDILKWQGPLDEGPIPQGLHPHMLKIGPASVIMFDHTRKTKIGDKLYKGSLNWLKFSIVTYIYAKEKVYNWQVGIAVDACIEWVGRRR